MKACLIWSRCRQNTTFFLVSRLTDVSKLLIHQQQQQKDFSIWSLMETFHKWSWSPAFCFINTRDRWTFAQVFGSTPNINDVHQEKPSERDSFDPFVSESRFLFELSLCELWFAGLFSSTSIIYLQPVSPRPSAILETDLSLVLSRVKWGHKAWWEPRPEGTHGRCMSLF